MSNELAWESDRAMVVMELLSARMGLEVRGAMMNTPQQKDIPNV